MQPHDLERLLHDELSRRRDAHQSRQRQTVRVIDATHLEIDGRRFINFASNNYLGLTHHPRVTSAIASALIIAPAAGRRG